MGKNIAGIGENAVTSIFSFSHNVFRRLFFSVSLKILDCVESYKHVRTIIFNPLTPNEHWILHVYTTNFLKTQWEKEKFLVTSNSPFPTVFSTSLKNFFCFFQQILNCSLQTLSVWKSLKFVVWERVDPNCFNSVPHNPDLIALKKEAFENIFGKEENTGNHHHKWAPPKNEVTCQSELYNKNPHKIF